MPDLPYQDSEISARKRGITEVCPDNNAPDKLNHFCVINELITQILLPEKGGREEKIRQ